MANEETLTTENTERVEKEKKDRTLPFSPGPSVISVVKTLDYFLIW
jgi:hypothetical protein